MTKTTKYLLVGGGVLVAVLAYRAYKAKQQEAAKPTALQSIVGGAAQVYKNLSGFSY